MIHYFFRLYLNSYYFGTVDYTLLNIAYYFLQGFIAGVSIAVILPTLAVLRLQPLPVFTYDNIYLLILVVYGVVVAVGGTAYTIWQAVGGISCEESVEPAYCLGNNSTGVFNISTTSSP